MRTGLPRLLGLAGIGLALWLWGTRGEQIAIRAQEAEGVSTITLGAVAFVLRSDGQLFLLRGGYKHSVPTLTLPAEALDAIPDGEPVAAPFLLTARPQEAAVTPTPVPTPRPLIIVVTATPRPAGPPTPVPTAVAFGTPVRSQRGGEPGATGGSRDGPWEYTITGAERLESLYGRAPKGVYIVVYATLTSFSRTSGVAGDGREVKLSDVQGRYYEPLYDTLFDARRPKSLPLPHDPIWPEQPFQTAWVYDIPPDATGLRLLVPLGVVLDLGLG